MVKVKKDIYQLYMMVHTEESETAIAFELVMPAAVDALFVSLNFALQSITSVSSVLLIIVRAGIGGACAGNILPTNFLPMLPFACVVLLYKKGKLKLRSKQIAHIYLVTSDSVPVTVTTVEEDVALGCLLVNSGKQANILCCFLSIFCFGPMFISLEIMRLRVLPPPLVPLED